MTDKQRLALLRSARDELERTGQGYIQWKADGRKGVHWKNALADLGKLEADLKPSPVPNLGPIFATGKSVLLHDLTHATAGVPLYPAFDDAFAQGTVIIAPEPLTVTRQSSANPGEAFFALGKSKIEYWVGHLDRTHPTGTTFAKGAALGRVAANSIGGGPHSHWGLNVERIAGAGKQLVHHTDYTHGAPLIGAQLRRLLGL